MKDPGAGRFPKGEKRGVEPLATLNLSHKKWWGTEYWSKWTKGVWAEH